MILLELLTQPVIRKVFSIMPMPPLKKKDFTSFSVLNEPVPKVFENTFS